jgi:hypothetical protein
MSAKILKPGQPQCVRCGKRCTCNAKGVCDECVAKRTSMWVVVGCVAFILLHIAALSHSSERLSGQLGWMQVYADEIGADMGLPRSALVVTHRFGSKNQTGDSLIGFKAGETFFFVRINEAFAENGPVKMVKNTIRHELCHLRTFVRLGRTQEGGKYHGPTFKSCARRWGVHSNYVAN